MPRWGGEGKGLASWTVVWADDGVRGAVAFNDACVPITQTQALATQLGRRVAFGQENVAAVKGLRQGLVACGLSARPWSGVVPQFGPAGELADRTQPDGRSLRR